MTPGSGSRGAAGLERARAGRAVDGREEWCVIGAPARGVGVLGLEVGDGGRVVSVAEPGPVVGDVSGDPGERGGTTLGGGWGSGVVDLSSA